MQKPLGCKGSAQIIQVLSGQAEVWLQVAESCQKLGATSTHVYPVDLSKPELVEDFAKRILKEHDAVTVLVCRDVPCISVAHSLLCQTFTADLMPWQSNM